MQLIIKCNSCDKELIIDYTNIMTLGEIEIRTAPCGCDRGDVNCTADKCEEIRDNIDLRKELKELKSKDINSKPKLSCFGRYKSTLSCCECLDKSNCMEKTNEKS